MRRRTFMVAVLTHEYLMWWEAALELLKDSCEECGGRPAEEGPDLIPQSPRNTERARIHFSTQNSIRSAPARAPPSRACVNHDHDHPSFLPSVVLHMAVSSPVRLP